MNFIKRWIIARAIWGLPRLDLLLLPTRKALREQWNVGCFGVTRQRVLSALLDLAKNRDVVILRPLDQLENSEEFEGISLESIECLLGNPEADDLCSYYLRCTPQSTGRWESETNYDWSRHCDVVYPQEGANSESEVETVAISGCNFVAVVERINSWTTAYGRMLLADGMEWSMIRPWKATYWKVIPYGVEIVAQSRPLSSFDDDQAIVAEEEAVERRLQLMKAFFESVQIVG